MTDNPETIIAVQYDTCVDTRGCHFARLKVPVPACTANRGCNLRQAMASSKWPQIERALAECEMQDGKTALPIKRQR